LAAPPFFIETHVRIRLRKSAAIKSELFVQLIQPPDLQELDPFLSFLSRLL